MASKLWLSHAFSGSTPRAFCPPGQKFALILARFAGAPMLGLPQKDHHAPTSVVPRARLAVRNAIRSTPRATATILLLMVTVLVLTLWRCSGCSDAHALGLSQRLAIIARSLLAYSPWYDLDDGTVPAEFFASGQSLAGMLCAN